MGCKSLPTFGFYLGDVERCGIATPHLIEPDCNLPSQLFDPGFSTLAHGVIVHRAALLGHIWECDVAALGIKIVNLITLQGGHQRLHCGPIVFEPLTTSFIVFAQNVRREIRRAIDLHFREVDDIRRVLHQVHLHDHELVIPSEHLRHPETINLFSNPPVRESLITIPLIELPILIFQDFDCRARARFPDIAIRAAAQEFIDLYAAAA